MPAGRRLAPVRADHVLGPVSTGAVRAAASRRRADRPDRRRYEHGYLKVNFYLQYTHTGQSFSMKTKTVEKKEIMWCSLALYLQT